MFLGNLKIGTRLGLAFGVVLVMVLGIIGLSMSRLESQDALLNKFASGRVPPKLCTGLPRGLPVGRISVVMVVATW
jgi:hypothetical protein